MSRTSSRLAAALAAILLAAGAGACAGGGPGSGGDPDIITRTQLDELPELTVFRAIQRLRPAWLNERTTADPPTEFEMGRGGVVVYIDGIRENQGLDALHDLMTDDIRELHHLDAPTATMQYGIDHSSGAILVRTRG